MYATTNEYLVSDFFFWSTRNRRICIMKSKISMIWEQSKAFEDISGCKRQNIVGPTTANINGRKTFMSTGV